VAMPTLVGSHHLLQAAGDLGPPRGELSDLLRRYALDLEILSIGAGHPLQTQGAGQPLHHGALGDRTRGRARPENGLPVQAAPLTVGAQLPVEHGLVYVQLRVPVARRVLQEARYDPVAGGRPPAGTDPAHSSD